MSPGTCTEGDKLRGVERGYSQRNDIPEANEDDPGAQTYVCPTQLPLWFSITYPSCLLSPHTEWDLFHFVGLLVLLKYFKYLRISPTSIFLHIFTDETFVPDSHHAIITPAEINSGNMT